MNYRIILKYLFLPTSVILIGIGSSYASINPTTLERVPVIYSGQQIWEITTAEIANWAGYSHALKYPADLEIKNIVGTNMTLMVMSDCRLSRLLFMQTTWGEQIAFDEASSFGNWGHAESNFSFPCGVAIGSFDSKFDPLVDYIYVVDVLNRRIVRLSYDLNNNQLIWVDSFGQDELVNPRGIIYYDNNTITKNDDQIFVTDIELSRIVRYDRNGNFQTFHGTPGRGNGQIFSPYGISKGPVNSTDWNKIFITDIYNNKVVKYSFNGNNLTFVKELAFAVSSIDRKMMGITADNNGFLYVADRKNNELLKLDVNLNLAAALNVNTAGTDFDFYKPEVVRYFDNGLVVVDRLSETTGFRFYEVAPIGTLKWSENWYGNIALNSDLLVPCGTTLNFGPGTHVQIEPDLDQNNLGIDPDKIEIIVEGRLNSSGMVSDSVLYYSSGNPAGRGDWYGIRVQEPCGTAVMSYSSVRDADYGIEFYDMINDNHHIYGYIKFCQLEKNAIAGIYANKGILNVSGNSISDNSIYGFFGSKTDVDLYGNQLFRNGRYGIWINLLSNPADSVRIVNDIIDGENGATTIDGLYLAHSQARVEGCRIKGYSSTAARVSSLVSPLFRSDTLECIVGMNCQAGASPTIRYSRILHNYLSIGIHAGSGSYPNLGDLQERGNNSVLLGLGTGYYIVNYNLNSIFAQYNWWGTTNPQPSRFAGPVIYTPYLQNEPPPPKQENDLKYNMPVEFTVSDNYPNPFNPSTQIDFNLPSDGQVMVKIYNVLGQLIDNLLDEHLGAGYHQIVWNATDMEGQSVGSGIYFVSFDFNNQNITKKVLLLR